MSPFEPLATGVARLGADARFNAANPAFTEHTGYGLSRLCGHTLTVLQPHGDRLHQLALRAWRDTATASARDVEVCVSPGQATRLDFHFTAVADGVLVETHPAAVPAEGSRVTESLRGFAHEVRNPLAAISGAAQLLQQHATDTRQHELAQLIRDEATRLASLSERLLGNRNTMATRAVNVHALLERAAELLQAERSDVTIVRDYDPSLPAWHGDPDRVLQALLNLIRNAVEANARRIVLRSRAAAGWRDAQDRRVPALRIEVEDDGDGVPDAITASLFEPLVTGRPGGSGLGLALAREVAREHGGDLTFHPCDAGSCFCLSLPRHPRAPEQRP